MLEYFPIFFEYKNLKGYLIWTTGSNEIGDYIDGIVLESNKIKCFNSLSELNNYSIENNLINKNFDDSDIAIYNMKPIEKLINKGLSSHKNYKIMLDTWNLLTDICASIYGKDNDKKFEIEISRKYKKARKVNNKYIFKVYDKIFFANNILVITPKDRYYIPIWNKAEKRLIIRIYQAGMKIFEENLSL